MNPSVILGIIAAAENLIELAFKARASAQQSKEWTADDEATFWAKLAQYKNLPHWQQQSEKKP